MLDTMGISYVGITARGPLHEWRFNMFLRDFFAEKSKDIIRCKGVLCVKAGSASQEPRLLHGCVVHSHHHSFVYSGILWGGGEFLSNNCCLGSEFLFWQSPLVEVPIVTDFILSVAVVKITKCTLIQ